MTSRLKRTLVALALLAPTAAHSAPYAFPIPFVASQHDAVGISFKDLTGEGTIKIYSIVGEEVASLPIAPGENLKNWNVTSSSGRKLATGVYVYQIEAGGQTFTGKIVVVR